MADNFSSIPVIDFTLSTSAETKSQFLSELRDAVVRVGFFLLKNHNISEDSQRELRHHAVKFFAQSAEEKSKSDMTTNKHYLGYVGMKAVESEDLTPDHRELIVLGKDHPLAGPDDPIYYNLRGINPWPNETKVPGFRPAVENYMAEIACLADRFKLLMAEALDLEPNAFARLFDEASTDRLMLAKYPEPSDPQASGDEGFFGINTHKDSSFLTFLLPGSGHSGLEVQNHSGEWVPAPPKPGHLIVNIGQQLDALSKGVCKATTHRVSLSAKTFQDENGNSLGDRYSFPYFQVIGLDQTPQTAKVDIPPHIMDLVNDEKVKSDASAYFLTTFKDGIGHGVFVARALKYRDVTAKFYPGLLELYDASREASKAR
ncbi:uncharacterized protein N7484_000756 [Penicillium longicatenatum]|uniref:uncharacterized protein n=1 Tax=Penicillium longicatenatum TaxID=1561947 RepID=UPI002546D3AC|nr:uncharacterized protein N7484_000756 [Penicillium longicatenatum]KAJ5661384.1 hypothetical protein N7484_000756 [Penicillium longicatenatum]